MKLGTLQKVFSKIVAQNIKKEQVKLEKDLKLLEKNFNTLEDIENHNVLKKLKYKEYIKIKYIYTNISLKE